jgi:hypothetical protein
MWSWAVKGTWSRKASKQNRTRKTTPRKKLERQKEPSVLSCVRVHAPRVAGATPVAQNAMASRIICCNLDTRTFSLRLQRSESTPLMRTWRGKIITALTLMGPASGPAAESGRILNQPAAPNLASVTSDSDACMGMDARQCGLP